MIDNPAGPFDLGAHCPSCHSNVPVWVVETLNQDPNDSDPTHAQVQCDNCARLWWVALIDRPT